MRAGPPNLMIRGEGPTVLLVHGSAADAGTWSIQLGSLKDELRMIAYDRRGLPGWPLPEGTVYTVADHARDAARVIEQHAAGGPVIACGSSFGAVVVLELARQRPDLVRGMVLCEPPLAPGDYAPAVPIGFGCQFDRIAADRGGEAAGAFFLRTVLGDAVFDAMPAAFRDRATAKWRQIRGDSAALARYRPRYERLGDVMTPALLLGGERSGEFYRPTLEALAHSLADAELQLIPGGSHMMHADAHRAFNSVLGAFGCSL